MKKIRYFMFLLILFMTCDIAYASTVYKLDDFVYFDPVTNNSCNETNYWTMYNQNTTCYRFVVLEPNDSASSNSLKIMLDHNVGYDTYDNYKNVLKNNTSNWTRYKGSIDIIDENTIYKVMKLNTKPTLENISVNGGNVHVFFTTNSWQTINGKESDYYGFWSKDLYEANQNYAYTVTEYGNNRLVERTSKRGIRPVITINKSLLTSSSEPIDITSLVKNAKEYKYKYSSQKYEGHIYKQLQGFTLTKDKLVFYVSNNANPNSGLINTYSGTDYKTLYKTEYGNTGHGNDMTYNSKTNKVLLVGPNDYKEIYEYNGDTLAYEKKYNITENGNKLYGAIGYDKNNDYYLALSTQRVYVLNNKFKPLYSFDAPSTQTYQGIEYKNGYLYLTTYESEIPCPSFYQLHCLYKPYSSITYVYNVKFNSNGTPTADFGRLVKRLYVGDGIGELESISFKNDQVYLGYATQNLDPTYAFKFYSFPYSKIANKIDYNVTYINSSNSKTIAITSSQELKNISGWTLSADLHTLSKKFTKNTNATAINVCDLYDNCSNVTLKALTFNNSSDSNTDTSTNDKDNNSTNTNDKDNNSTNTNDKDNNNTNTNDKDNNNNDTSIDDKDNSDEDSNTNDKNDAIIKEPNKDDNNISDSENFIDSSENKNNYDENLDEESNLIINPPTVVKGYTLIMMIILILSVSFISLIYNKLSKKNY